MMKSVKAFYRICIEPKSQGEDSRRREVIFNSIASTLLAIVVLLDFSVLYGDIATPEKAGFGFFTFSLFVVFFGAILVLSRKGHTELASYLFIGLYFLGTTYGVYQWGADLPMPLISYGAIIVIASVLLGTRAGFVAAIAISATLMTLGFFQAQGIIESDLSWRSEPIQFKDTVETSLVYAMIVVVSWLSNREIERSLDRARRSEKMLIEERVLLEAKVEERTKALKAVELEKVSQLYRFVEFGRLASGIFHDLLNPLSVVALSVEKLRESEDGGNGKVQADASRDITKAIHASKRMEAFLQTARKQLDSEDKKSLFSTNKEISDAIDLLLHKSHKTGVEMRFVSGDGAKEIMIWGNPVKFFQIAVNLISNAIDSYADKPPVHESAANAANIDAVTVRISATAKRARLTVEDKGCGIKEELRKSIFEPFFTTKQDRPRSECGFGLGLSTAKEIVERDFSGTIELETAEGKGSKFSVVIPLETQ